MMKNRTRFTIAVLMLLFLPIRQWAQTPYRLYADEGIEINFFQIDNLDFRLYLLYNIEKDGRFSILAEEENGLFVVNPNEERFEGNFFDTFESFYNDTYADFRLISKVDLDDLVPQWKESVVPSFFTSITMDIALNRATNVNNHCVDSDPFCTSDVIQFQAANSSQTADQLEGYDFDDGCIGNSYNPSWYHMRINTPGQFIIHMEGRDPDTHVERDIDFCMWGPFTDPTSPCVVQLTGDKIIDCSYSAYYSEDIFLGYPDGEHYHGQSGSTSHGTINYHVPEVGEYYILMITNFSREPCVITFTKTEGSGPGTTDCGILPGIASNDGPYCVGETIYLSVTTQAGATYTWTGPNNFSSTLQNPVITDCTLEMAGTYTCVTRVENETTTGSTEVIIYPQPSADFTYVPACEGSPVQFTSTSTTDPTGQEIQTLGWNFGDGGTASGPTVSHTFDHYGDYEVTLYVATGDSTCFDEKTMTVTVHAVPQPTVSVSPSSVIYGGTSTLTAHVEPSGNYTYHWEPANMVTDPDSQTTQTVAITETQVFTVTVTNTQGGCSSTAQGTVIMAGSDLTATATADPYEICENGLTTLHAIPLAGTGNYTYSWSPANLLNDATTQNPMASPPVGTTTFTCIVGDGMTEQEVSVTIIVHPNVEKDIYDVICANGSYDFFGQSISSEGVYHHTLQSEYGCDSIINLHLSINELDEVTAPDVERCDEFYWNPEGHEIVYTDHEDTIYNVSNTYHRTYLNQYGCDSLVTINMQFQYTPDPTPIYPLDPNNTAPHWVVTATEFQINSYEFHLWDNNPSCHWDSVTWSFENHDIEWVLEPDNEMLPKGQHCKVYVLNHTEDTVWLRATAFNGCNEEGVSQRYWLVCSFYGIEENPLSETIDFNVVPNPNNGHMTISFERLTGKVDMKVYDMRGSLVDHFETHNDIGPSSFEYDMKNKTEGIYFFVATSKEGTIAKKIIIE